MKATLLYIWPTFQASARQEHIILIKTQRIHLLDISLVLGIGYILSVKYNLSPKGRL
jgi:hypothetical protein